MMPIPYIIALLISLCLIAYYIFGTEETMWQINCEGILHGACAFSWLSLLLGRSWESLIFSGVVGFAVSFIVYLYLRSKYHSKASTDILPKNSGATVRDTDGVGWLIGLEGTIIGKGDGMANTYIGKLNDSSDTVVIIIENDEVKIGSPFEITQIKGCDIFAKLIDNMENKAES